MNVLIIKNSSLGDIIHALPALTDAKAAIPNIIFDWVVEENFAQIPKMHTAVQDVLPVAWRRLRKNILQAICSGELKQSYDKIRRKQYDLIIDAQGLIKSAIFAKIARGPSFGYDQDSARERCATYFYDHGFRIAKDQHAILRIRKLFAAALSYQLPDTLPDYGIKQQAVACESIFAKQSIHNDYIIFLHGTSREEKCWQEEKWIELASFANLNNLVVYLPWGNAIELERAKRIAQKSINVKVLPKLGLDALARLLQYAKAVVSVDTGLAHLAAALNIPVVALYGSTNPKLIGTVGLNTQIHLTDFASLGAADVWEYIENLLWVS